MSGGPLVDRGPDSHAVLQFCREKNIKSVCGNHESSIILHAERYLKDGTLPKNPDKRKTVKQLTEEDLTFIKEMPYLHVFDDLNLVLVHGGLFPKIPLYAQPMNVCRLQMIHPDKFPKSTWWGQDSPQGPMKMTEEQLVAAGWRRWTNLYDHKQDVIYGHSVYKQPCIQQNEHAGRTIGIDMGSCFGGSITACVYDEKRNPFFVSVKAKRVWFEHSTKVLWEIE